jgi:hypothetical protein
MLIVDEILSNTYFLFRLKINATQNNDKEKWNGMEKKERKGGQFFML